MVKEASGGTDGVLDFMVKLSLGRMSGPPFPERHLAQIRPEQCEVNEGQVMRLSGTALHISEGASRSRLEVRRRDRVQGQVGSRRGAAEDSGGV